MDDARKPMTLEAPLEIPGTRITELDGLLVVVGAPHPELTARAPALGGVPLPSAAWIYPQEKRDQVAALYRELHGACSAPAEPHYRVRVRGPEAGAAPHVCRMRASEVISLLAASPDSVEAVGDREALARWAEGEMIATVEQMDVLDRALRRLRPLPVEELGQMRPADEEGAL